MKKKEILGLCLLWDIDLICCGSHPAFDTEQNREKKDEKKTREK